MYLNSINNFRALSIIFIVMAHCYSISEVVLNTTIERVFGNLIGGSTIYFVFISGFLFHHIFYRANKLNNFFKGKLYRLLVPYTILSIMPIAIKIFDDPNYWQQYLLFLGDNTLTRNFTSVVLYYISGSQLVAYWYIPFAMVLFMMSPLHKKFIEANTSWQFVMTIIMFIIASLIHRPISDFQAFQSVIYFTPIYLMAIMCSMHKEKIYSFFKGKEWTLLLGGLSLALIQALMGLVNIYNKDPFVFDGIDLILIQKSILCLFFMTWLNKYENYTSPLLTILANTSFVIYFLHGYGLKILGVLKQQLDIQIDFPWISYFVVSIILITVGAIFALLLKKVIPKYSKYIIGY